MCSFAGWQPIISGKIYIIAQMESKSLLWIPQSSRDYAVHRSKTADFLQCEHSVVSIVPISKNEMNYFWVPLPVQRMDALSSRCDRDIRWGCGLELRAEHPVSWVLEVRHTSGETVPEKRSPGTASPRLGNAVHRK